MTHRASTPLNGENSLNDATATAQTAEITLSVNGEPRRFPCPLSCAGLITTLGLAGKRVALECNGEIVPRGRHAEQALAEGDKIEIVVAVGGG